MTIDHALRSATGLSYLLDQMHPKTPYGAERQRRLRLYAPAERAALEREWHNVGASIEALEREADACAQIMHLFGQMRDIRGSLSRAAEQPLSEVELFEIKRFLLQLEALSPPLDRIRAGYRDIEIEPCGEALALLAPDGQRTGGFAVSSAYSESLRAARDEKRRLNLLLREEADAARRASLLVQRQAAVAVEERESLRVRHSLSRALAAFEGPLRTAIRGIARLDTALQRALLARRYAMVRPTVVPRQAGISAAGMRNPEVADALEAAGRAFAPVTLDAPEGATVITGANMGGKSVALRTLVLSALLSQAGCYACAERFAFPLFDGILLPEAADTDAARGLSSFGAEVLALQRILERLDARAYCLIALDEPARGTNPREGAALVRALTERLAGAHSVSVIATHYEGAASGAMAHYQAAGIAGVVEDPPPGGDRLAFLARHMTYGLRRVESDAALPQEALQICRLLGLDTGVTARMRSLLEEAKCDGQPPPIHGNQG